MQLLQMTKMKPVYEFDPARTYTCAVIGDSWVEMAIIQGRPDGRIWPIRAHSVEIPTNLPHCPSINQVLKALSICWGEVAQDPPIDYENFVVCLPAWVCRGRDATCRVSVGQNSHAATVEKRHVRDLCDKVSGNGLLGDQVVVDLIPYGFTLDSGREVADPVGETTHSLRVDAHLVLAENAFVTRLLDFFHDRGLRTDFLASPYAATSCAPDQTESQIGTAVIDLDRRRTLCSFYRHGTLHHATHIETGVDNVHYEIAARVGKSVDEVRSFLHATKQLLLPDRKANKVWELPLFAWASTHPTIQQYQACAVPPVQKMLEKLTKVLNVARREMMVDTRKLVFVGDDPLSLCSLVNMAAELEGLHCRIEQAIEIDGGNNSGINLHERTALLVKRCAQGEAGQQPFLDRHNERFLDAVSRMFRDTTLELARDFVGKKVRAALADDDQVEAPAATLHFPVRMRRPLTEDRPVGRSRRGA